MDMLCTCGECGVHVVYMWCTCGVHVMYIWFTCGVHVVYMWRTCGVNVVYIWCPCPWEGRGDKLLQTYRPSDKAGSRGAFAPKDRTKNNV